MANGANDLSIVSRVTIEGVKVAIINISWNLEAHDSLQYLFLINAIIILGVILAAFKMRPSDEIVQPEDLVNQREQQYRVEPQSGEARTSEDDESGSRNRRGVTSDSSPFWGVTTIITNSRLQADQ
jgi:hypothetical protein